jgi:hypothetical protein
LFKCFCNLSNKLGNYLDIIIPEVNKLLMDTIKYINDINNKNNNNNNIIIKITYTKNQYVLIININEKLKFD